MKIAFTWDYELFFGVHSGTVSACMLHPTNRLLEIAKKHQASFTFFPDAGYLLHAASESSCAEELDKVECQIKTWDEAGHETGLHIHPHWEDSIYSNGAWQHDLKHYKLSDFKQEVAREIIHRYHKRIQGLVNGKVTSYRAGGWCVQPFEPLKTAFEEVGIVIDSSVFKGGKNTRTPYNYDFTDAPMKDKYSFVDDVLVENSKGHFLEIPIASFRYSPLFFWRLFILGRLNPKDHKGMGDGVPAAGGGSKKKLLTQYNTLSVNADGYFITKVESAMEKAKHLGHEHLVVIGHPKACTNFSLKSLDLFMEKYKSEVEFVTLSSLK